MPYSFQTITVNRTPLNYDRVSKTAAKTILLRKRKRSEDDLIDAPRASKIPKLIEVTPYIPVPEKNALKKELVATDSPAVVNPAEHSYTNVFVSGCTSFGAAGVFTVFFGMGDPRNLVGELPNSPTLEHCPQIEYITAMASFVKALEITNPCSAIRICTRSSFILDAARFAVGAPLPPIDSCQGTLLCIPLVRHMLATIAFQLGIRSRHNIIIRTYAVNYRTFPNFDSNIANGLDCAEYLTNGFSIY